MLRNGSESCWWASVVGVHLHCTGPRVGKRRVDAGGNAAMPAHGSATRRSLRTRGHLRLGRTASAAATTTAIALAGAWRTRWARSRGTPGRGGVGALGAAGRGAAATRADGGDGGRASISISSSRR